MIALDELQRGLVIHEIKTCDGRPFCREARVDEVYTDYAQLMSKWTGGACAPVYPEDLPRFHRADECPKRGEA